MNTPLKNFVYLVCVVTIIVSFIVFVNNDEITSATIIQLDQTFNESATIALGVENITSLKMSGVSNGSVVIYYQQNETLFKIFETINESVFNDVCIDTCGLQSSFGSIVVLLRYNATLTLDSLSYTTKPIIGVVQNVLPVPEINLTNSTTLNLSTYFVETTGASLTYYADVPSQVRSVLLDDVLFLSARENGMFNATIVASNGGMNVTNEFLIFVSGQDISFRLGLENVTNETNNITNTTELIQNYADTEVEIQFNESVNKTRIKECIKNKNNYVEINSSECPELNKSATITFFNVSFTQNITILRNGEICPTEVCSNLTFGQKITLAPDKECYDDKTQIMTEKGWKKFYNLSDEMVATLNQKTMKTEYQQPTTKQVYEHNGEMYKIVLEDGGELLLSPEHKVYGTVLESKSLLSSSVVKTLTTDCSLRCGSFDHIGIHNLIANAKYGESLGSDINDLALLSCCGETVFFKSTDLENMTLILSNLSFETPSFMQRVSEYFSSSSKIKGCEHKFKECFSDNLLVNESFFNKENATLVSITNCIYNSFLSRSQIPSFARLPSSKQSSSVNVLFLVNSANSSNNLTRLSCLSNSCLADSDQLTHENSCISPLILSGIEKVTDAIYNSPLCSNSLNFFNCPILRMIIFLNTSDHLISGCLSIMHFFNSSGIDNVTVAILIPPNNHVSTQECVNLFKPLENNDFKLQPIIEVYSQINKGEEVYFLNSSNRPVKVVNITKEHYNGSIFDVDVPNDVVLVKRNGTSVWSGNSNSVKKGYGRISFNVNSFSSYSLNGSTEFVTQQMQFGISDSVSACGIVNSSGATLTANVVDTNGGVCFDFNESGGTLDCQGWNITANPFGGIAINISPTANILQLENVTIKNCNIKNFSIGINISSASNISLFNNNITNVTHGIWLNNTALSVLENNSVNFTVGNGIMLINSSNNTLNFNNGSVNNVNGNVINLASSNNNILNNNTADVTGYGNAIILTGANNRAIGNYAKGTARAAFVVGSSSTLINNVAKSNGRAAFHVGNAANNVLLIGNNGTSNSDSGFYFITNNNHTMINNTAKSDTYAALSVLEGSQMTVINNTFEGRIGVFLRGYNSKSSDLNFTNNTFVRSNTGIEINWSTNVIITNSSFQNVNWSIKTNLGSNVSLIDNERMTNYTFANAPKTTITTTGAATIDFFNIINANGTNLSMDVNLTLNRTFVNTTKSPGLNVTANITFYNVALTNPVPIVDFGDTGIFAQCPITICTNLSYSGGTFIFNTSHFTTFAVNENLTQQPRIDLILPENATQLNYSQRPFNFSWNVTSTNTTLNCNLLINNSINVSVSGVLAGVNYSLVGVNLSRGNDYTWAINCSDGTNNNQTIFRIFNVTNTPPIFIQNMTDVSYLQNRTFYRQVNATDPDGDIITFGSNSTRWNINPTTGIIDFKTDEVFEENDTVSAADDFGGNTTQSFVLKYNESRPNIQLNLFDGQSFLYYQRPFNFTYNATTPPNTNVTLNTELWINNTLNVSIIGYQQSSNGSFYVNMSRGFYTFFMKATDGFVSNQTITLNVQINNSLPYFVQNMSNESIKLGQQFYRQVNATDLDEDTINYSNNQTDLFNISSTGVINTTPTDFTRIGLYNVVITINDTFGGIVTSNFTYQINNSNTPIINITSPTQNQIIKVGTNITFEFMCSDDVNQTLNANLYINGTLNQTFTQFTNGTIQTLSRLFDEGSYQEQINCTDGYNTGNSSLINFFVENLPPHIDLINPQNATIFVYSQRPFNFTFNASDDINNTLNCNLLINNSINVSQAGIISGTNTTLTTNLSLGTDYTWGVNCTDGYKTNQTVFRIFNVTDNTPPTIILNNPPDNYANETWDPTNVTFNCSATDDYELSNISLYITNAQNNTFTKNQTTNIGGQQNSTEWTLQLPTGNYTWNCQAQDTNNNTAFALNNRSINNNYEYPTFSVNITVNTTNSTIIAGTNATYQITITNNGTTGTNGTATSTYNLTIQNPQNATIAELNQTTITLPTGTNNTILLTINSLLAGTYNNTITATLSSNNTINSTTPTITTTILPAISGNAIINLTKTSTPNPIIAGQQLNYTITINNTGNTSTTNTTLTENYPTGTTFIIAAPTPTTGNNIWNLQNITNKTTTTINITLTTLNTLQGTITNNINLTYNNITGAFITINLSQNTTILPQPTPGPTGGTPGGGTAGPTIIPTNKTQEIELQQDFGISRPYIKKNIKKEDLITDEFIITNTADKTQNFTIQVSRLNKIVRLSTESFELKPGEMKTISVAISADKNIPGDVYTGSIIIQGNNKQKEILVVINVASQSLFDIKVKLQNETIQTFPGETINADILMYNMGDVEPVDVNLHYSLRDMNGNELTQMHETLAITTQKQISRSITIPNNIKPGNYLFYAKITYENQTATSSSLIEVNQQKPLQEKPILNISLRNPEFIITTILQLFVLTLLILLIRKNNSKKQVIDIQTTTEKLQTAYTKIMKWKIILHNLKPLSKNSKIDLDKELEETKKQINELQQTLRQAKKPRTIEESKDIQAMYSYTKKILEHISQMQTNQIQTTES